MALNCNITKDVLLQRAPIKSIPLIAFDFWTGKKQINIWSSNLLIAVNSLVKILILNGCLKQQRFQTKPKAFTALPSSITACMIWHNISAHFDVAWQHAITTCYDSTPPNKCRSFPTSCTWYCVWCVLIIFLCKRSFFSLLIEPLILLIPNPPQLFLAVFVCVSHKDQPEHQNLRTCGCVMRNVLLPEGMRLQYSIHHQGAPTSTQKGSELDG